ncbi:Metallo-peptidase family M12-domain-containing protein [Circinella umbellata]|nr:Metallo-peptidase family M12-domain-containing protein [Circinella umbellata]
MTQTRHFRSAAYLLCLTLLFIIPWVDARSVNNRKLEKVEGLGSVQLDIATRPESFFKKRDLTRNPAYRPTEGRAIEHDDILRLAVPAFNQTFYLHLHPNDEIFHPNAVITVGDKQERVRPHEYRVYRGYVIDESFSRSRWQEDQAGLWRDSYSAESDPGVLGWARITIRRDIKHDQSYPVFEGAFRAHQDTYHVKATNNYRMAKRSDDADLQEHHIGSHMVIYRDSDTVSTSLLKRQDQETTHIPTCGYNPDIHGVATPAHDEFMHNMGSANTQQQQQHNPLAGFADPSQFNALVGFDGGLSSLHKRAPPAGCPTTKKIAYIGAAADCTYAQFYQSPERAREQIINDFNTASAVYERTFNVQLGLINITVKDAACPSTPSSNERWNQVCSTSYTITNRLSDFSRWRGSIKNDGASLWHLMTSCASGVEVGVAWLNQLCQSDVQTSNQGGQQVYTSGTAVSSITRDEWTVVAHEVGHNFGAIHDCTADTCPCSGASCQCCPYSSTECDAQGRYIMNPSSNVSTEDFSPCTIGKICEGFPQLGSCLEDPGSRTIATLQMCGNGIKEDGEDCDPGGNNSTCCDASTCKFINNAKCDDSSDLCCQNCQPRPKDTVCRAAASQCDVEEKCPGDSGDCPKDSFKTDGDSCGDHLQCASGQCTSRDQQCRQRGSDMKISKACGSASGSCQMICDNPGSFSCLLFNGFFIDGTPCGVGGACKNGECSLDNFGDNAKNWIENNKQIAIPVLIVVGLLVLFCIFRCLCYGCCGLGGYRTVNNKGAVYVTTAAPPPYGPSQPYYPQPGQQQGQWVDPGQYNGAQYNAMPPSAPPPSYTPGPPANREAYEMNAAQNWNGNNNTPSPGPGEDTGGISGRVRRFEERMSPR